MEQISQIHEDKLSDVSNHTANLIRNSSRILLDLCSSEEKTLNNIFEVKKPPKIRLKEFLEQIAIHSELEDSTLIVGIILIDRLTKEASLKINKNNIHRILIAALEVAIKLNEDVIFSDKDLAAVSGINLNLFIELELNFLLLLDWRIHVSREEFLLYKALIEGY